MFMQKGDMVSIEVTGKDEKGMIFESTKKEHHKHEQDPKQGTDNEHDHETAFRPRIVVIGKKQVLPGIENALLELNEGEEKEFELTPEDAFGERRSDLIRVIPLKHFTENKMNPFPGLIIQADGMQGKVQTVSGGRVRVDFNHELAGKKVFYTIKVLKKLSSDADKAQALAEKYFPFEGTITKLEKEILTVSIPKEIPKEISFIKEIFIKEVKDDCKGIKEVKIEEKKEATKTKEKE